MPHEKFSERLESIKFRGPDFTGISHLSGMSFGHLRLAILDLDQRSNQPLLHDDLILIFNGEIYNFEQLRVDLINVGYNFITQSDSEVLLKGYHFWGKGILDRINGMFAFVIYNKSTQRLFGARDRLGVKPFYYSFLNGALEICSQLRPIAFDRKLNEEALSIYLDCGYVPSPYSIYQNVHKLCPGNYLEVDFSKSNPSVEVSSYWDLKESYEKKLSYEQAKEELHTLLIDAVKIRMKTDVPFGSFLSGGIDSALVSSIACKTSEKTVRTFSVGFDEEKYDESKIAKSYANHIESEHTEMICTTDDFLNLIPKLAYVFDEPFGDSSALPSLLLNKMTKEHVTVALSGDGGDESFLGYDYLNTVAAVDKFYRLPLFLRLIFLKLSTWFKMERIKRIASISTLDNFITSIFIGYYRLQSVPSLRWLRHYERYLTLSKSSYQKAADLNIKLWLENDSNVKVDRASMAYSVEVRSPFLDYRIIEFARNLPVEYRFENKTGTRKKILRDILKEYIPESLFDQPKKGFSVPIAEWIRNELKEEFKKVLNDDFLHAIPNFNKKLFMKMYQDHMDGKQDFSVYIWRVYVLAKWNEEFEKIGCKV